MSVIAVACAAVLVGCETMKGLGEDVQGGGRSIERVAEKND